MARRAENARPLFEAGSAKAFDAGAIGLVIAGFEDIGDAEIGCDALNGFGHGARMGLGLDDAGTGDEEEPARADLHGPDFKGVAHERDCNVQGSVARASAAGPSGRAEWTLRLRAADTRYNTAKDRARLGLGRPSYSPWLRDHSHSARSSARSGVGAGRSLCGLTMLLSARRLQKARYSS